MPSTPLKTFATLACVTALLSLAGCVNSDNAPSAPTTRPGLATEPEGPSIAGISAAPEGATVTSKQGSHVLRLHFPTSNEKPAAVVTFSPTDISDRLGIALQVRNTSRQSARVYADLNGDTWVRGYVTVPAGRAETLYIFARRKKLSANDAETFPGMHGIPGGKMSLWAGIEEPVVAKELRVFLVAPQSDVTLEVSNVRPFGSSALPNLDGFFPFIDRFGQYRHKDWPGKTHGDSDLKGSARREDVELAAHPAPSDFDRFGGWTGGPQLKSTGHFRVEKYAGKWWLVDPDGRLFWSNGIDCVGFVQSSTPMKGREKFYEDPAPMGNFLNRNLEAKYGSDWREIAGDRLLTRVRSWGMNTLGGGADRAIALKRKVPYTLQLQSGGRSSPIDPKNPAWAERLRATLTSAAETINNDPWCIGFFVDNEIHASDDPTWFEDYYRQVSALAKELIPNKLYLGSRLDYHDWPDVPEFRKEIVRHAAKYCDVISFNFYKFTLDDVVLPAGVDRPSIIGEFHMGALDRGQFHTGLRAVIDQNQRAEAYRRYVTSAAQNPAIVGAHWFQMYDESTTGRFDGENYQIGFLDICDTPYTETVAAARDVGYRLYKIRSEPRSTAHRLTP